MAIQALAVGLGIDEAQRIGRARPLSNSRYSPPSKQQLQARERVDAAVPAALGADVPVGFQVLFPDDLAAALALLPQALGAHFALAVCRLLRLFVGILSRRNQAMQFHVSAGRDGPARLRRRGRSARRAWRAPIRAERSWRRARAERSARAAQPGGRPSCPPIRKTRSRPSISARAMSCAKAASPWACRPGRGKSCGRRDVWPRDRRGPGRISCISRAIARGAAEKILGTALACGSFGLPMK
jgi:hypothetical protein